MWLDTRDRSTTNPRSFPLNNGGHFTGAVPVLRQSLTSSSDRSRSTHVGICRAKELRLREEVTMQAKRGQETLEAGDVKRRRIAHQQDVELWGTGHAAAAAATTVPATAFMGVRDGDAMHRLFHAAFERERFAPNPADLAWLKVYFDRRDMSSSLLDDVLPLCGMTPSTHFTGAQSLFSMMDGLPGPSFRTTTINLPNISEGFNFAYRTITDVVEDLIRLHNGSFLNPFSAQHPGVYSSEFVDGSRFQDLQRDLTRVAGPRAILMPVILNSGTSVPLVPLSWGSVMRCSLFFFLSFPAIM